MAVVNAHLRTSRRRSAVAPGVSRAFADVVHRALAKRPGDRFRSADAMRDALLATAAPGGRRARPSRAAVERDGDAGLASRADFAALGKQVRALPGRAAPLVLAALVAAGAALAWRWDVAHGLLAARAPALAAALPRALQPAIRADGGAPVPDDPPDDANRLSGGAGGDPARAEGPEGDSRSEVRPAEAQANEEAGDLSRTPERDPLADGVGAAALEQEAPGAGTLGEEEALGAIALATSCSAEEIWARAEAFLARAPAPAPERAAAARVLAARAAEELSRASPDDPALRSRAADAWRAVAAAGGPDAAAARARGAALAGGDALAAGMPLCP